MVCGSVLVISHHDFTVGPLSKNPSFQLLQGLADSALESVC